MCVCVRCAQSYSGFSAKAKKRATLLFLLDFFGFSEINPKLWFLKKMEKEILSLPSFWPPRFGAAQKSILHQEKINHVDYFPRWHESYRGY